MSLCFCVSSGCSTTGGTDPISRKPLGKLVDPRTLKAHANTDRKAVFHAAQQNTEAALDTQIEEITAYLSASVLADEVSGPSHNPGGSLWSRLDSSTEYPPQDKPKPVVPPKASKLAFNQTSPPTPAPPGPTPSHSPPRQASSRRSREADVLACLADIEAEVDIFNHQVLNRLAHLGQPSPSGPPTPFPHADLLPSSKEFKSRLDTITLKTPAVFELKDSVLRKLHLIESKVTTAKRGWKQELSDIKAMNTPEYGLPHKTGQRHPLYLSTTCTDYLSRPPF